MLDPMLWPNNHPIVDGIVPVDEVSQDPNFLDDEEADALLEMGD